MNVTNRIIPINSSSFDILQETTSHDEQASLMELMTESGHLQDRVVAFLSQHSADITDQIIQNIKDAKLHPAYEMVHVSKGRYNFKQENKDNPKDAVQIRLARSAKATITTVFVAIGSVFGLSNKEVFKYELDKNKVENGFIQVLLFNKESYVLTQENKKELEMAARQCRKLTAWISSDVTHASFQMGYSAPSVACRVAEVVVSGLQNVLLVLSIVTRVV